MSDTNALNNLVLPQNVDVLFAAYASGGSGYPICCENNSLKEKLSILKRALASNRLGVKMYIEACVPKLFFPYAGFNSEQASRDVFIKEYNLKMSSKDINNFVSRIFSDVETVDPLIHDTVVFDKGKIERIAKIEIIFIP